MKKFFTVLLSVILVLAFASTGVFADDSVVITDFPDLGVNFVQLIPYKTFFKVNVNALSTSDYTELFNGLSAKRNSSSGYQVTFLFQGSYYDTESAGVTISFPYLYFTSNQSFSLTYFNTSSSTVSFGYNNGGDKYIPYSGHSSISLSSDMGVIQGSGSDSVLISPPSSSNTYHLSLPYGNAMRIYSDSPFTITSRSYTLRDTTYNFQKYVRASDDFSYRVNGTYQGVVQNSSLVGNFSLSVYGSDNVLSLLVPWQPTNQNILGRATAYNYYSAPPDPTANVAVGSGESFLIWYPYYANNQDTSMLNEVPMDMAITIEHSSPVFFMTYLITGNPSAGEDTYISNTSNSSDSGTSQQTDDGDGNVTVTFDNAPTAGGNHGQAPINQNNSILGVLSNLQNTLLGLFNKAIDGIHNLISLGSDFLQSVQVMFSWLPSELLVIITSGFVILLTIGVLKTLWH